MKNPFKNLKSVILILLCFISYMDIYGADSLSFRSFISSDLADAPKAVKRKIISTEWTFKFTNNTTQIVKGLYFESGQEVVEFVSIAPFISAINPTPDKKKWLLTGGSINPGEQIIITGRGTKKGMKVTKWYWKDESNRIGAQNKTLLPAEQKYLLPMPNLSNVGEELFKEKGFPSGMKIGVQQTIGSSQPAWLKLAKWKDIQKTLKDKTGYHIGNPDGFGKFTNEKPILGLQKSLPPKKYNNRLLAEVIALKLNIVASDLGRTPVGFGDLIFNEGGDNPLNGLSIKNIASKADSALTYWTTTEASLYTILDDVIHKINTTFNGPIDTLHFGQYTSLTGVKSLSEVSFLTLQKKASQIKNIEANTDSYEKPENDFLAQNYPNPFNPYTQIEFQLPVAALVTVKVFDILGREIAKLAEDQEFAEGINELEFNGTNLPAGIYFYSIIVQDLETKDILYQITRKMILNK